MSFEAAENPAKTRIPYSSEKENKRSIINPNKYLLFLEQFALMKFVKLVCKMKYYRNQEFGNIFETNNYKVFINSTIISSKIPMGQTSLNPKNRFFIIKLKSQLYKIYTNLLSVGGPRRNIIRLSDKLDPYIKPIHESEPGKPYLLHIPRNSVSLSLSQHPIITSLTELKSRYPSSRLTDEQSFWLDEYFVTSPGGGIISS